MPSAEEEHAVFDNEEDDDDDDSEEGDESDEEYDDDDDAAAEAPPPNPPPASDPNQGSSSNPTYNPSASAPASGPITQNGATQPVPLATAAPDSSAGHFAPSPDRKQQKRFSLLEERRTPASFDESRRLFQRLWTDDDEIVILRGFLEFTSQRGTTHANYQHDTGPFYEQIRTQLQLDFTKNQLIEKLRRLKKKYRNVVSRMNNSSKEFSFKSAHEKAIYEIARHIWSSTFKRPRSNRDDNFPNPHSSNLDISAGHNRALDSDQKISRSQRRVRKRFEAAQTPLSAAVEIPVMVTQTQTQTPSLSAPLIPSVIEETVRCCLSPLFKELLHYGISGPNGSVGLGGGVMLNPLAMNFGGVSMNLPQGSGAAVDEKWRKQQILELEVYLKRLELLQEQIKSKLEELRSTQS